MSTPQQVSVLVFDDNPVHFSAFKTVADSFKSVSLAACLSVEQGLETYQSPQMVLINMDQDSRCSDWLLLKTLKAYPEAHVLCYVQNRWMNPSLLHEFKHRLSIVSYSELLDGLTEYFAAAERGDSFPCFIESNTEMYTHDEMALSLKCLTGREFEVLCLLGKESGAPEIAEKLECSRNTVEWHLKNICRKLNANGMKALRKLALNVDRLNLCRTFSVHDNHICPDLGRSVGSCPFW